MRKLKLKKTSLLIAGLLSATLLTTGCNFDFNLEPVEPEGGRMPNYLPTGFLVKDNSDDVYTVVDKETRVEYVYQEQAGNSRLSLVLLVDKDGKPKLYEGELGKLRGYEDK